MKESVKTAANAMIGLNDITLKGEIAVFGSTYMSKFPLYEFINKCQLESAVYNRSIKGLTIEEALQIVEDCIIAIAPKKVFIALGEEDENNPNAIKYYNEIIKKIRVEIPACHIFLIGLLGESEYLKNFNNNILSLCDNKKIKHIQFVSPKLSELGISKARFKQMSCFFRDKPLTMVEAFAMAN